VLTGDRIILRARMDADVAILHAELHDDVDTFVRANAAAWRPQPTGRPESPFAIPDTPKPDSALFSVVLSADGHLAGAASVWGLDQHNRLAHLGLSLLPAFRGQGLGSDIVRVLCDYGFRVLGLHRLQIETLADNAAMRSVAERCGFQVEGIQRQAAWVLGRYVDEIIYGRLSPFALPR